MSIVPKGIMSCLSCTVMMLAIAAQPISGHAQFSLNDAILDTSRPFAVGAIEAEQTLRGSFGWQTFQEGLALGVYYRFDPDGYARFSISPRLDQDTFEVVCEPTARACIAKKGPMEMALTTDGNVLLAIDSLQPGDALFMAGRTGEVALDMDLQVPLTPEQEALLVTGLTLIVRRDGADRVQIPLTGFNQVATYLKWVRAGQDPSVFPRGWPAPVDDVQQATGGNPVAGERLSFEELVAQRRATQSTLPAQGVQQALPQPAGQVPQQDPASLENEILILRQQVAQLTQNLAPNGGQGMETVAGATPQIAGYPQSAQDPQMLMQQGGQHGGGANSMQDQTMPIAAAAGTPTSQPMNAPPPAELITCHLQRAQSQLAGAQDREEIIRIAFTAGLATASDTAHACLGGAAAPNAQQLGQASGTEPGISARLDRLETLLGKLVGPTEPAGGVDLGAGVFIERDLIEQIIEELDHDILSQRPGSAAGQAQDGENLAASDAASSAAPATAQSEKDFKPIHEFLESIQSQ